MNKIGELLLVFMPVLLVLVGVYYIVKNFLKKQLHEQAVSLKTSNSETILPLRIQAYERMTLFLERITPNNLLLRMYDRAELVSDFQQLLLKDIREEYYHNLAQQIYVSVPLWDEITKAMNEVMVLINTSASELKPDEPALNLSKKIFEKIMNDDPDPTAAVLVMLKEEVQGLY